LVEGLAEAILIPKLGEIYLQKLKEKNVHKKIPVSLEEAGISVINMNGIYFQYFMQLFRGYRLIIPVKENGESKEKYELRVKEFIHKEKYTEEEYKKTDFLPIRCVAITDNDPDKETKPTKVKTAEGYNPQLFNIKQLENMTENCRVFVNLKTFEYDMALNKENAKVMIEIILDNLETEGDIKRTLTNYVDQINKNEEVDESQMAFDVLKQVDANYIGKGLFAQLLSEQLDRSSKFEVPDYIKDAINFVLEL
jgi:predicted ATP-dependent endonuclease of OLD family